VKKLWQTVFLGLLFLATIWLGAYLFGHVLPSGWQHEWYALPTMLTYIALLGVQISVFIFREEKKWNGKIL
jgi:hypothetical protein